MKAQRIHYQKKKRRRTRRMRPAAGKPHRFVRRTKLPGYYFLSVLLVLALVLAIRLFVPALLTCFVHGGGSLSFPGGIQTSFALSTDEDGLALPRSQDNLLALAISRLGDPCFASDAEPDDYLDCSALVQWCFAGVGVALPRTAAEQAEYCRDRGLTIPASCLQAGDLIFWSFEKNGRFQDISHTGIYAGNGRVIDASLSQKRVVLRPLYETEQIVLCGRIPF